MNSSPAHAIDRNIPAAVLDRPLCASHIFVLLQAAALALASTPARAQFTLPYALTPPDPGVYSPIGHVPYGGWWVYTTIGALSVITTSAPTSLTLHQASGFGPFSAHFWTQATDSGTVSFGYVVGGTNEGRFSWFTGEPAGDTPISVLGTVSTLVSDPTNASFSVQAGDYFGFYVEALGYFPFGTGVRVVTIDNFAAPVIPLEILSLTLLPGPTLRLEGHDTPGLWHSLYSSSNLVDWERIATQRASTNGSLEFNLTLSSNSPMGFYRLARP